jgi:acetyltransferase-like isoleucine patch superfamily enzyme
MPETVDLFSNPLMRFAAGSWFAVRRHYYRIRYPRLRIGCGVIITGRLRLIGKTQLTLGAYSVIRQTVWVDGGGQVTVGEHTRLNGDCWIGAQELVEIADWCLISDCCIFDSDYHNVAPRERHLPPRPGIAAPIHIGRNAWIGTRALVTKGSVIGDDSVVGAGAVVRGTVPPGVVVIGNPAIVVKTFTDADRSCPAPERPRELDGSGLVHAALARSR